MGALAGLAKFTIGFLSTLFFLIGVAFLVIVGIVAVEFRTYADGELFKDVYLWAPVGVGVVVGLLLLLIGVLGVIGVCCEKGGALRVFSVLLTILIILEITAGVLIYVYRAKLDTELHTGIRKALKRAYGSGSTANTVTKAVNKLQSTLNCCGGNGTYDYTSQNITVPSSCCVVSSNCTDTGPFRMEGCTTKLTSLYKRYANIVFGVAIGFAVLEIIAVIYSCCVSGQDKYA